MKESLSPSAYAALREEVGQILAEGKLHSRRATEWERVETYWNVGNAIHIQILQGRERAEYGEKIIAKVTSDMNLGLALMHDIVLFRRALNILYTYRPLTWSHYRVLTRLPTVDQRRFYERAAVDLRATGVWCQRNEAIERIDEVGRRQWRKESGAHQQARAENGMYRYKRIIGDRLQAQHREAQKREALIAVNVINRMTALGMSESVKIG